VDISSIVAVVKQGNIVVSGEDSMMVDAVLRATAEERKATFYVPRALHDEIMTRYWTPERVRAAELEPVSDEEARQIRAELDVEINGYSNRIDCPRCGHVYGMQDFLRQGIEEHGREVVRNILSLEDAAVIRVNPVQIPVCPNCNLNMRGNSHYYCHCQYGCCMNVPIV
jgi:hypothetical protein